MTLFPFHLPPFSSSPFPFVQPATIVCFFLLVRLFLSLLDLSSSFSFFIFFFLSFLSLLAPISRVFRAFSHPTRVPFLPRALIKAIPYFFPIAYRISTSRVSPVQSTASSRRLGGYTWSMFCFNTFFGAIFARIRLVLFSRHFVVATPCLSTPFYVEPHNIIWSLNPLRGFSRLSPFPSQTQFTFNPCLPRFSCSGLTSCLLFFLFIFFFTSFVLLFLFIFVLFRLLRPCRRLVVAPLTTGQLLLTLNALSSSLLCSQSSTSLFSSIIFHNVVL